LVYEELKGRAEAMMRREHNAQSMQATLLVSDAFMRLVGSANVDFASRNHFFALASNVMRRVLVEHARARGRAKRGGDAAHVPIEGVLSLSVEKDDDVLRLEESLVRLAEVDPQQAQLVTMRFYGGMSMQDVAAALGVSKRSCERDWTMAKAWLRRDLAE
jgi:RNA polymerase sigma-70 factor, ECF subfamily